LNKTDFITFQTRVATGSLTLPVALVLWALCGLLALPGSQWPGYAAAGVASGYLLIELNTAYSLIRQRTTLHLSTFLLLSAAGCALGLEAWQWAMAPLFLLSVHQLFATYESPRPEPGAFNAFFCLGLGSFVFAPLAWLLPVWLIGLYQMRALSLRSFLAGLIGFLAPWWCYYGVAYSFFPEAFTPARLQALVAFAPVDYAVVPMSHWVMWGVLAVASVVSDVHYAVVSYMDKVRTRLHLSFLVFLQIVIYVLALVQPVREGVLWSLQLTLSAVMVSHLFTLTRTRVVSYYFLALFLLFIALPLVSIWIV
jgi:hypothetical protein